MSQTVTHVALVQTSGMTSAEGTMTKTFTNKVEADEWVKDILFNIHGGENFYVDGSAIVDKSITRITTDDGPSWGVVIEA